MSKFAEKLRRIYRGSAPSMGFRKSAELDNPLLLIVADLTKASVKEAKAIAGAGIDAGIVSSEGLNAASFEKLVKAAGDVPLGLFLESASKQKIAKLGDFVVFGVKMPLEVVNEEGVGKLLKIEPSLDQGLVRAINELPIDGVLVAGEESQVTIERLLICQRFAELLGKPLLVTVGSSVASGELSSLCEAGISGLLISEGLPAGAFADLKKSISSLPRTAKRKARGAALLPRLGGELGVEAEEEEEEEI
jgi:hypothetical protein